MRRCHTPTTRCCRARLLQAVPGRVSGRRSLSSATATRLSWQALTALSSLCANAVVTNSAELAADAAAHEWLRPRGLTVIPNGVEIPDVATDVRAVDPVGMMIANLRPMKGHLDLVEAMRLVEHRPLIRLVGEGPERSRVEAAISAARLDPWFRLEGSVPNAASHLGEVQFCVQPSTDEGLPNAVLEAMAAGLPVVSTRVGGIPDLIDDEVTGLLVAPGDPEALAAAVTRLVTDESLRLRLGAAARERARDFSWQACADRHVELYEMLLRDHPRRRGAARRLIASPRPKTTGA